jgi:hypothetical protein
MTLPEEPQQESGNTLVRLYITYSEHASTTDSCLHRACRAKHTWMKPSTVEYGSAASSNIWL